MSHAEHNPADRSGAYTGFIVGAIVIGLLLFSIVKLTNSRLSGEGGEKAATEAPK
jgi:hypothetical protein